MKYITYLLENLKTEELSVLQKLLTTKENNIPQIEYELGAILLPSGIPGIFARFLGIYSNLLSYDEIIKKIATHNKISLSFENGPIEAEQILLRALFNKEYDKLSETEQNSFIALLKKEFDKMSETEKEIYYKQLEVDGLNKSQITSLAAFTSLVAAQTSGFGVYLLASSTIGAISSAVGITLPFALYTTVSSIISILTGPIGFLIIGITFYNSFKKNFIGDYEKATMCFKYIAAMRTIIPVRYKNEINEEENKVSNYLTQNKKTTIEINNNVQQINSSRDEITILNNRIQELQNEINNLKIKNYSIQSNIKKTEEANINLRNDITITDNAINKSRTLITKIAAKLQEFLMKTKNQD